MPSKGVKEKATKALALPRTNIANTKSCLPSGFQKKNLIFVAVSPGIFTEKQAKFCQPEDKFSSKPIANFNLEDLFALHIQSLSRNG